MNEEELRAEIKGLDEQLYQAKNETAALQFKRQQFQGEVDPRNERMKAGLEKLMKPSKT